MSGNWAAIGQFIKEIGFPIFVAVYLLLQITTLADRLDKIADSLEQIERTQAQIVWLLRSNGSR